MHTFYSSMYTEEQIIHSDLHTSKYARLAIEHL